MSYLVIARKYRPMAFDDVIGQEHVTTTLRNAIESGRIAHAYIFSGPRGVGKTTTARILAKAINCEKGGPTVTPCNECLSCTEITGGRSLDVLEIDGASNRGIDEIRSLRDNVRYMPVRGGHKIYIIDEFHMITKDAFNALLKTLEEPPPQVIFIFATTEPNKILPTILSRCQRFDFKRVPTEKIVGRLKYICREEKVTMDDESLFALSQMSDGGMRDSLTLLDQAINFCGMDIRIDALRSAFGLIGQDVYFELTDIIKQRATADGFRFVGKILDAGWDITEFLHGLLEHIRNIMMAKACGSDALTEVYEGYQKKYAEIVGDFSEGDLLRMMNLVSETIQRVKWSLKQKFAFELMLMKLIHLPGTVEINALIERLNDTGGTEDEETDNTVKKKVDTVTYETPAAKPIPAKPSAFKRGTELPVPSGEKPADISRVQVKWGSFLARVKKEKIRVGAILEQSFPAVVSQDVLHVGFRDNDFTEFHAEIIHKEKDYLANILKEFIGQRLRIECDLNVKESENSMPLVVSEEPQQSEETINTGTDGRTVNNAENEKGNKNSQELFKQVRDLEQSEPLKKLVELFDGELIDVTYKSN